MSDWGPVFMAVVLFILLTPGLLFQVPGRHRCVEFGNFQTSGASIMVHTLLYFSLICVFLLAVKVHLTGEQKHLRDTTSLNTKQVWQQEAIKQNESCKQATTHQACQPEQNPAPESWIKEELLKFKRQKEMRTWEFDFRAAACSVSIKTLAPGKRRRSDVRLGAGGVSGGAICAFKPRIAIPVAREEQNCRVWEHAYKWVIDIGPHHHLLRPHNHLSHCYWSLMKWKRKVAHTYTTTVAFLSHNVDKAFQLSPRMRLHGCKPGTISYNSLIHMHLVDLRRSNKSVWAYHLFEEMIGEI
ncbi:hypothetical protein DKX38_004887 [Salix brachista]|uniref:Uncharacterized protein n=1 Tax=Salix brachista TaxID=2182728 RepID=A0A5N5NDW0_9ROSI|nr:hypothetical protein DKX38_004887 [Salix brachista]